MFKTAQGLMAVPRGVVIILLNMEVRLGDRLVRKSLTRLQARNEIFILCA
jgi:hypothetical protein